VGVVRRVLRGESRKINGDFESGMERERKGGSCRDGNEKRVEERKKKTKDQVEIDQKGRKRQDWTHNLRMCAMW